MHLTMPSLVTPSPIARIIEQYRAYLEEELDKGTRLKHMTRHLLTLFQGKPGAKAYRRYLSTHMYEELAGIEVFDQASALVQQTSNYPIINKETPCLIVLWIGLRPIPPTISLKRATRGISRLPPQRS